MLQNFVCRTGHSSTESPRSDYIMDDGYWIFGLWLDVEFGDRPKKRGTVVYGYGLAIINLQSYFLLGWASPPIPWCCKG